MSVLMIMRANGDVAKLEEMARKNPTMFSDISQKGKAVGAIHHDFYATEDALVVIDEWDSPESFQAFFDGTPGIAQIMAEAGVTEPPDITFLRKLDLGDSF